MLIEAMSTLLMPRFNQRCKITSFSPFLNIHGAIAVVFDETSAGLKPFPSSSITSCRVLFWLILLAVMVLAVACFTALLTISCNTSTIFNALFDGIINVPGFSF